MKQESDSETLMSFSTLLLFEINVTAASQSYGTTVLVGQLLKVFITKEPQINSSCALNKPYILTANYHRSNSIISLELNDVCG